MVSHIYIPSSHHLFSDKKLNTNTWYDLACSYRNTDFATCYYVNIFDNVVCKKTSVFWKIMSSPTRNNQ